MSLRCNKTELLEGLLITEKGKGTKSNIPHLNGFLLNVDNGQLRINTYDLEMGIEYRLKVISDYEGESIVLPAKFADIVRKLPEEELELKIDSENMMVDIKSGKAFFELNGLDPEEFPSLPEISNEKAFSISPNLFKRMIEQTSFAVSKDETKPAFTGILMRFEGNNLDMVATDSFRLGWKKGEIINENEIEGEYIVPSKALTQISKIIEEEEENIKLYISNEYIISETENIKLFSKLINEKFPDLEQVIPKNYQTLVTIEKKKFIDALERASLLASEGANNIIKLNIDEGELTIVSNSPQTGKLEENLQIDHEGDILNIALNARFMIEVLRVMEDENVNIEFSGAYSPLMLKSSFDSFYLHLILPVRAM